MGLEFYSQEDTLCEPEEWLTYWKIEPNLPRLLDIFELGDFGKLEPWLELCNQQGIELYYFDDTVLKHHQLPQVLANLRQCYGQIAQSPPFLHPSEMQRDPFLRMVAVLETAISEGRGIIAVCD